ncbi:MAG TPA: response regulator [Actinomycetota bacterium]|jgi:two-component system response regulator MprA|nr:response regulator [Actinomycetota bacterium]
MARILVVDDSPDIRRLLEVVLAEEGHMVSSATDGEDALEAMAKEPPDLVVLDIMMPKKDGFMVLKEMRSHGVRDATKVLVLTARTAEVDWLRGYKLGADQYLTKPFDNDELIKTVTMLLGMSKDELRARRQQELDRAQLLSRLEALFHHS